MKLLSKSEELENKEIIKICHKKCVVCEVEYHEAEGVAIFAIDDGFFCDNCIKKAKKLKIENYDKMLHDEYLRDIEKYEKSTTIIANHGVMEPIELILEEE